MTVKIFCDGDGMFIPFIIFCLTQQLALKNQQSLHSTKKQGLNCECLHPAQLNKIS
jgi:hypothetical protein